jgi:hypothetical protein
LARRKRKNSFCPKPLISPARFTGSEMAVWADDPVDMAVHVGDKMKEKLNLN